MLTGPAQEDDLPMQRRLQVELPAPGKWRPGRGVLASRSRPLAACGDVPRRARRQLGERGRGKAGPHLRLPAAVEVFQRILESGLARRRKHRHNSKAQTQPHDPANGIDVLVRPLNPIIVIELGVAWQATPRPSGRSAPRRSAVPSREAPARQPRDPHATTCLSALRLRSRPATAALHDIEAIELGVGRDNVRQVPTARRCRTALVTTIVERPVPVKNPPDGAHAGRTWRTAIDQRPMNHRRTGLTEGALLFQFAAYLQDQGLGLGIRAVDRASDRRAVSPIDTVQPLPGCAGDPTLHGVQAHLQSPCDGAQRGTPPDHRDHVSPLLLKRSFLGVVEYRPSRASTEGPWKLPDYHRPLPLLWLITSDPEAVAMV